MELKLFYPLLCFLALLPARLSGNPPAGMQTGAPFVRHYTHL